MWRDFWRRRRIRRRILLRYREAAGNLEAFHVMSQRNRFRPFMIEAVTDEDVTDPVLGVYLRRLRTFNEALKEAESCEAWYKEDLGRRTRETARALHEKRDRVAAEFAGLEPVIKAAHDILKQRFLEAGGAPRLLDPRW